MNLKATKYDTKINGIFTNGQKLARMKKESRFQLITTCIYRFYGERYAEDCAVLYI